MLATSRALSGIFMWHARFDITCVPLFDGINHATRRRANVAGGYDLRERVRKREMPHNHTGN